MQEVWNSVKVFVIRQLRSGDRLRILLTIFFLGCTVYGCVAVLRGFLYIFLQPVFFKEQDNIAYKSSVKYGVLTLGEDLAGAERWENVNRIQEEFPLVSVFKGFNAQNKEEEARLYHRARDLGLLVDKYYSKGVVPATGWFLVDSICLLAYKIFNGEFLSCSIFEQNNHNV